MTCRLLREALLACDFADLASSPPAVSVIVGLSDACVSSRASSPDQSYVRPDLDAVRVIEVSRSVASRLLITASSTARGMTAHI